MNATAFGLPSPCALYVHVPFCPVICPYCDFHKMRRNEALVSAYLDRIEIEAADLRDRYPGPLDTIYLGGGTPSHLTDGELDRLVDIVHRAWGWPAVLETTLEADPLTFDAARAVRFREMGFSRLSIGLQSTDDRVLSFLGRAHDSASGLRALEAAVRSGCDVNADVIAAVPLPRDLERELSAIESGGVHHISVYSLTVEPNTPFAFSGVRVDPDQDADEFDFTHDFLVKRGWRHYEISNYARPGHESAHNRAYWRGDSYLALGPGASSFLDEGTSGTPGVRRTAPLIRGWLAGESAAVGDAGTPQKGEAVAVDAGRWVEDVLMTGLRTAEGVDLDALGARTGLDVERRFGASIEGLVRQGLLTREGSRIVPTRQGARLLNTVVTTLLETVTPELRT